MENNAQLLKGVLEYCVLRLIEKEPTYGYEIVMQLKQVGFAEISESTLYPLLLRLEQQEKVPCFGGNFKVFIATGNGSAFEQIGFI